MKIGIDEIKIVLIKLKKIEHKQPERGGFNVSGLSFRGGKLSPDNLLEDPLVREFETDLPAFRLTIEAKRKNRE